MGHDTCYAIDPVSSCRVAVADYSTGRLLSSTTPARANWGCNVGVIIMSRAGLRRIQSICLVICGAGQHAVSLAAGSFSIPWAVMPAAVLIGLRALYRGTRASSGSLLTLSSRRTSRIKRTAATLQAHPYQNGRADGECHIENARQALYTAAMSCPQQTVSCALWISRLTEEKAHDFSLGHQNWMPGKLANHPSAPVYREWEHA